MRDVGVGALERVEALLDHDPLYELAAAVPEPSRQAGGRRRQYPMVLVLLYEALISVYGSARQVEAELAHPMVWGLIRRTLLRHGVEVPAQSMRRHHYLYVRSRYLTRPDVLARLGALHRELGARTAREMGLLDPAGPGSWTHPHLSRVLHADGKVIAPLYRAKPGDRRLDPCTGEIVERRAEPDAGLHFEGTGETAWGTKFVLVACRTEERHGRVILDVEWVPKPGGEASVALDCFTRVAEHTPGAQAVIYDTALRGTHHQRLLRDLGLLPINRVAAAQSGGPRTAKRGARRRVPKTTYVETKTVGLADGSERTVDLHAQDGAIGLGQLTDKGELHFVPLTRIRTHRNQDKNGRYRWYSDYQLPDSYGGGMVTVRLHGNTEDAARKFNRAENVRAIPPSDPDFARLYPRRNDIESINRHLDDTMWLGRAHSLGHSRQQLNLLGFALAVNALAVHRHRKRRDEPIAA